MTTKTPPMKTSPCGMRRLTLKRPETRLEGEAT
jgi:hypothetical protein